MNIELDNIIEEGRSMEINQAKYEFLKAFFFVVMGAVGALGGVYAFFM